MRISGHFLVTPNFPDLVVNFNVEVASGVKREVGDEVEAEVGSTKNDHEGDDVPVKVKVPTGESRDVVQCPQ